jgi:hypothetical protein
MWMDKLDVAIASGLPYLLSSNEQVLVRFLSACIGRPNRMHNHQQRRF